MQKSADAFRTISEVADDLSLPQHVLRFWETRFPQIRPLKRAGGRRYYRPADVLLLKTIRQLLYDDGYTIKGVQRLLKEQGAKGLSAGAPPADLDLAEPAEVGGGPEDGAGPDDPVSALDGAADAGVFEDGRRDDSAVADLQGRNAVEDALGTIDECKRILDAVLRLSR